MRVTFYKRRPGGMNTFLFTARMEAIPRKGETVKLSDTGEPRTVHEVLWDLSEPAVPKAMVVLS